MIYLVFFILGFLHGYVLYRLNYYVLPKIPNLWCWHAVFGITCVVLANYWFVWPSIVSSQYVLKTLFFTFLSAFPGIYIFTHKQFIRCIKEIKLKIDKSLIEINLNGKTKLDKI